MDDAKGSLADLAAAWDEVEDSAPKEEVVEEVVEDVELEQVQPDTEAEDTDPESSGGGAEDDSPAKSGGGAEVEADIPDVENADPVPVSLPAAAREEWGKVPKAVKEAVMQREKDFAVGIQRYAENAKRAQQMDQALAPYAQYFAMNQQSPSQGIKQVLSTAANLQMGSPQQRAQTVAKMINDFGVDVPLLDKILTGTATEQRESGVDPRIQQQIDAAIAPFRQREQQFLQAQQEQQRREAAEAGQTVNQFGDDPKNEFYRDVRGDMADILDMAANRGRQMTMKEAYDKACMLNPEIARIIQSRQTQQQLTKKKQAAVSVRGNPGGTGEVFSSGSISDDLNAAWDSVGQF